MSEVWMTHPNLTPAHDMKVLRAAIGTWSGSGWQIRKDQTDPAPEVEEPPAAAPSPAPPVPTDPETVTTSSGVTTKKGH